MNCKFSYRKQGGIAEVLWSNKCFLLAFQFLLRWKDLILDTLEAFITAQYLVGKVHCKLEIASWVLNNLNFLFIIPVFKYLSILRSYVGITQLVHKNQAQIYLLCSTEQCNNNIFTLHTNIPRLSGNMYGASRQQKSV